MNNKNKNDNINTIEYFKLIVYSMFAACLFLSVIIFVAQDDVMTNARTSRNDKLLQEYIRNTVIAQNEDLETEYPDNYNIDLYLGYLHKIIQEYDKAEFYYKKAVEKAPAGIYKPVYELASFYIERGKIGQAEEIVNILPNKANNTLLKYKALLSEKLGDYYNNNGQCITAYDNYDAAITLLHKRTILDIDNSKRINDKIYNITIDIADYYVNNDNLNDAEIYLERALRVSPNDFKTMYKYALVTATTKPETSYKYFKKLFKKYPMDIDYKAYYNLITNLASKYEQEGDYTKAELYEFRAKDLVNTVARDFIYKDDFDFHVISKTLYNSKGKTIIVLGYSLQNTSNIPIKKLGIEVVYKLNGKVIDTYNKVIASDEKILGVNDYASDTTLMPKYSRKYKKKEIKELSAEIYLYKNPDKRICVYNEQLFPDNYEYKKVGAYVGKYAYLKFVVHQILNFNNSLSTFKNSK